MDSGTLRFIACGSVDDGKSTLIGRLLLDANALPDDVVQKARSDTHKRGLVKYDIDPSLLLDGLSAEREQGITIDIAHRYFDINNRSFIVVDAPGHDQYTSNMVTGASTCHAAVLVVDIANGISEQTRRHAAICSMVGIESLIVAVNKMDMVGWDRDAYKELVDEFNIFVKRLDFSSVNYIPVSALYGTNVTVVGDSWYEGDSLVDLLGMISTVCQYNYIDFRLPIQRSIRTKEFRGYAGSLLSGTISVGEEILEYPGLRSSKIKSIISTIGDTKAVAVPESVVIELEDDIDISQGSMLFRPDNKPMYGSNIEAMIVWMSTIPMKEGAKYIAKTSVGYVPCTITKILYKIILDDMSKDMGHTTVYNNDIARCCLEFHRPIPYDVYSSKAKITGSFVLIDPYTTNTIAASMIIDRSHDTTNTKVAELKPSVIWLTGAKGSGKTTLAKEFTEQLCITNQKVIYLDEQYFKDNLNSDLSNSIEDSMEAIRRIALTAKLLMENGNIVICAVTAPLLKMRKLIEVILGQGLAFVHVDASIDTCIARGGELDLSPPCYDIPEKDNLASYVNTEKMTVSECVQQLYSDVQSFLYF